MLQRALKIDRKRDVQMVKGEYTTLQRLQQSCKQVVRVYESGDYPPPAGKLAMKLPLLLGTAVVCCVRLSVVAAPAWPRYHAGTGP